MQRQVKKKVYRPILRELVAGHKDPKIRKMTQADIAEHVKATRQTIIRWFKSEVPFDNPPYTDVALRLADLLGEPVVDNLWKEDYVDVDVPQLAPVQQLI
jgi:DNA-binding XRE family transcriptional regulator